MKLVNFLSEKGRSSFLLRSLHFGSNRLTEKANILQEKISTCVESIETLPRDLEAVEGKYITEGFVNRFKQRHGIRKLKCVGEKASADKSAADVFANQFQEFVLKEKLTREQVYNADETGLCWRATPTTTLAGPDENKIEGLKLDKDRVTLMACANSLGTHKLDLLFIYKYANPRALKHCDKSKLPVKYYCQSKAWMNMIIFESWFNNEFAPSVGAYLKSIGLEEKAILVLDNAPSHVKFHKEGSSYFGKESKIRCIFLPPNTTSVIQPMDQGVLDTLKRYYRKKLMRTALNETNQERSMIEVK